MVKIKDALEKINNYKRLSKKRDFSWIGDSIEHKGIYLDNSLFSREDMVNKYVVYMFCVKGGIYVGTTNNIVRRLHEHFTRRDGRIYSYIGEENCIYATILDVFDTEVEARTYEKEMITALQYCPQYNLINSQR